MDSPVAIWTVEVDASGVMDLEARLLAVQEGLQAASATAQATADAMKTSMGGAADSVAKDSQAAVNSVAQAAAAAADSISRTATGIARTEIKTPIIDVAPSEPEEMPKIVPPAYASWPSTPKKKKRWSDGAPDDAPVQAPTTPQPTSPVDPPKTPDSPPVPAGGGPDALDSYINEVKAKFDDMRASLGIQKPFFEQERDRLKAESDEESQRFGLAPKDLPVSTPIFKAQQAIEANKPNAMGVHSSLGTAREAIPDSKDFLDLHTRLAEIANDFDAGRASGVQAQKAIAAVTREATDRSKEQEKQAEKTKTAHVSASRGIAIAYGVASAGMMGFVRSGMQGTAEGARMSFGFQMLNREIAGIFTPAIHGAINALERAVLWFRNLSGAQQDLIGRFAISTTATLGFVTLMPKVISGVQAASAAFTAAFAANPILLATAAMAGMLVATEGGREAITSFGKAAIPIMEALAKTLAAISPIIDAIGYTFAVILEPMAAMVGFYPPLTMGVIGLASAYYLLGTTGQTATQSINFGLLSTVPASAAAGVAVTGLTAKMAALNLVMKANPLLAIISVVSTLAALFGILSSPKPKDDTTRRGLSQAPGGLENFEATWERIQNSINKTDIQQGILDQTSASAVLLAEIKAELSRGLMAGLGNAARFGMYGGFNQVAENVENAFLMGD